MSAAIQTQGVVQWCMLETAGRTLECSACKAEKPTSEFYTHKRFARGYQYSCKACTKAYVRQWAAENPEKRCAQSMRNFAKNRERENARRKAFYERDPDAAYRYHIKNRHGLTWEMYCAILSSQDGACAVCRCESPGGKGRWHVDHDHATGVVRALLCHGCNVVLTETMTPERLRALALYLEKHNGCSTADDR